VGTVVVDSSVVIGFLDQKHAHHARAVEEIRYHRGKSNLCLPSSVLAEVLVSTARYSDDAVDPLRTQLRKIFGHARVVDDEVAVQAAKLRAQHRSLRLPDALVIATGIVDDAEVILTGDKRWAGVDQRVQVLP
jgi:predicted nucleic acid-binding protein